MFDLRRFGRLARVQWAEHGRGYLWFLAIGVSVHLCVWLLITKGGTARHEYVQEGQVILYIVGYLLTGSLFALRYFAVLTDRGSALTCLMRPASSFEKTLLAFLVVGVLYPIAYTLAFQICNVPGALLGEVARDRFAATEFPGGYVNRYTYGPYVPFFNSQSIPDDLRTMLAGTALQALIIVGTLFFRRTAWLKTVVALFVVVVLMIPLLAIATDASPALLLGDVARDSPEMMVRIMWATTWLAVPATFWISVYFLLRERELQ